MHPEPNDPQAQGKGSEVVERRDDVIPRVVVTEAETTAVEESQASAAEHGEVHVKWKEKEINEGTSPRQNGEDGHEDEAGEGEEEENKEMTEEEKKEMYETVVNGDIDLLEDLLNKPNADINMTWFNENLLMAAIRAQQTEMAEFLLDNGVNQNFCASFVDVRENSKRRRRMDWYQYSCRQMAYDQGMSDIVDLIDSLNGELPYWIKPRDRIPRIRKPPPEPEVESEVEDGDARPASGLSNMVQSDASSEADIKDAELGRRRASKLGVEDVGYGGRGERRASCKSALSVRSGDSGCHSPRAPDPDSGRRSSQQDPDVLSSPSNSSQKPRSGADDGYGTLSFKSSQCLSPDAKPEASRTSISPHSPPPAYKWTKGAIQRQQLHHHQQRRPLEASVALQPKVRAAGSYSVESSLWHQSGAVPASRVTSPESTENPGTKPVFAAMRKRIQESKNAEAKLRVEASPLSRATSSAGHARKSSLKKKVHGAGVSAPKAPIEAWGEKGGNSSKRRDSGQGGVVHRGKFVNRVPSSPRVSTRDVSREWEDKSAALAARRQKRVAANHSATPQLGWSTPYTPLTPGYLRLTQSASFKMHAVGGGAEGVRGSGKASDVRAASGSSLSLRPSLGTRNQQTYLSAFYLR